MWWHRQHKLEWVATGYLELLVVCFLVGRFLM
jgi:hypothetical protein